MMLVLGIILISLELVIGSNVYWRDYNGTVPSEAFVDNQTGLAVAKIFSKKYSGIHPTGLNSSTGSELIYETEKITENIKVLCTDNPEKVYWEWVTATNVRLPTTTTARTATFAKELLTITQNRLVEGGYDSYGYVYVAKMFIKGDWYIGEIDGDYCYFYNVADCSSHYVTRNYWCQTADCMVLKYQ